tara:strand:- start:582 stop:1625 length:1044 start_codon:yes stop_codon:yes gene_type:complete
MKNREISDEAPAISNSNLFITCFRVLVRLILNLNHFFIQRSVLKFLEIALLLFKASKTLSYAAYLSRVNRYRLHYMFYLNKLDFNSILETKKAWANFVINHSSSKPDVNNAKFYLDLINEEKNIHNKLVLKEIAIDETKELKNTFYLQGPNVDHESLNLNQKGTLVLTKPPYQKLKGNALLFLNSVFYNKNVENNFKLKSKLANEYLRIFVKDKNKILSHPFSNSKEPDMGHLGSPMGLGIVLLNLVEEYGNIVCKIEGFDFYTKKEAYSKNYQSLMKDNKNTLDQSELFLSIASHDPIIDFLYVKKLIVENNIQLLQSTEFLKLISLELRDFFLLFGSAHIHRNKT